MMKEKTSIVFACLLLLLLTACGSEASFEKYVKDCDYSKAIAEYRDHIEGNSNKELDALNFYEVYINECLDQYERGEISDNEMQAIVDCYLKIDSELYLLNADLGSIVEEFSSVQLSRENYEKATAALENGDYEEAIEYFASIQRVDVLDYDTAVQKLVEVKKEYCDSLIAEADELIAENRYEEAYQRMAVGSPTLDENVSYTSYRDNLEINWVNYAVKEANTAFGDNGDYEAAIRVLQQVTIPSDTIDAEIARYQEYIPVRLTELEYTKKATYIRIGDATNGVMTDVNGQTYDEDGIIYPCGGSLASEVAQSDDEAYVVYYLNAQYNKLTGTIYRPYITLSSTNEWTTETVVKVYGDGVLLYEAPNITKNTYDTIPVSIDVTGVRELKIVMRGVFTEHSGWVGMYDRDPKVCFGDVMIQKTGGSTEQSGSSAGASANGAQSSEVEAVSKVIDQYFAAAATNDTSKVIAVFPQDIVNELCGDDVQVWGETLKSYTVTSFNSLNTVSAEKASKVLADFLNVFGYSGTVDNVAEVIVEAEFENTGIDTTTYEFICSQRNGAWELWYVDDSFGWVFSD